MLEDNSLIINGDLMFRDKVVAKIVDDIVQPINKELLPLFFKYRSSNIDAWLRERIFDSSRTNVRLMRKILNIRKCPSKEIGIRFHGIALTDCYWIRQDSESRLTYENVSSLTDRLYKASLKGESRDTFVGMTPEVTNLGSFEKCWVKRGTSWYLEKVSTDTELFSEILVYRLGKLFNFNMASYKYDKLNNCISSKNFTFNCEDVFLDEMKNCLDDNEDYLDNAEFISLLPSGEKLLKKYIDIIFMDTLCYNFDRHTGNYGFLRSGKTGEVISVTPNYDNNNTLISREYRESCSTPEFLITSFKELTSEYKYNIPDIDFEKVDKEIDNLYEELKSHRSSISDRINTKYVKNFIRNNYKLITDTELIKEDFDS